MSEIHVKPEDVYDVFEDTVAGWSNSVGEIIAEDENYDLAVTVEENYDGFPMIVVYAEGEVVYDQVVHDAEECQIVAEQVYMSYIDDYYMEQLREQYIGAEYDYSLMEPQTDLDQLIQYKIESNEEELGEYVSDFLSSVCPTHLFSSEEQEDIKDHFLEYIARKFNVDIYRPMFLEDEDGMDFYTEYPYKQMLFDDPDNPVYKKSEVN